MLIVLPFPWQPSIRYRCKIGGTVSGTSSVPAAEDLLCASLPAEKARWLVGHLPGRNSSQRAAQGLEMDFLRRSLLVHRVSPLPIVGPTPTRCTGVV